MEHTVGEVARSVGVSVRTLHHWEAVGLVAPSGRQANGYRAYGDADVDRVRAVRAWRPRKGSGSRASAGDRGRVRRR